ncbi:MAG: response regulator [Chloroflexi bacterium]|nr:response regulator [Chloroflexota bacterium]
MNQDKARILVVDDEQAIRRFLHVALTSQGYTAIDSSSGQEGISAAATSKPDAIVLDLGLPDMDGVEVIRLLREWTQIPIIVLSVRGSETDKIAALDAGADDYVTKPFGLPEFLARLRAALRRAAQPTSESLFEADDLKVDLARRLVTLSGKQVQLTPNEYDLLRCLVVHAGKVLTHRQILREVWGLSYEREFHMLHVNISNLRRKIESDRARPRYIVTESGVGYRLKTS